MQATDGGGRDGVMEVRAGAGGGPEGGRGEEEEEEMCGNMETHSKCQDERKASVLFSVCVFVCVLKM